MAAYKHYYVNDTLSNDNDHEVHEETCYWLGITKSKSYVGYHNNCASAVRQAKEQHYWNSNGCKHCSPLCHTT